MGGQIIYHFKGVAPEDVEDNTLCSLDYANSPKSVKEISEILKIHRNNVLVIERSALHKFKKRVNSEIVEPSSPNPGNNGYYRTSDD